jgi:hypothetical protein
MAFARTIFAALIAISLAMLPANAGAAISTKPVEMSTMSDQTDTPPCCPPTDDGKGSIACTAKCLNFIATMFPPPVVLSHFADGPPQYFEDGALHGFVSPPTHPPPI